MQLGIPKSDLLRWMKEAGIRGSGERGKTFGTAKSGVPGGNFLGMRRSALNRLQRLAQNDTDNDPGLDDDADSTDELRALRAENAELRRQLEMLTTTALGYAEDLAGRLKQDAEDARKFVQALRKKR